MLASAPSVNPLASQTGTHMRQSGSGKKKIIDTKHDNNNNIPQKNAPKHCSWRTLKAFAQLESRHHATPRDPHAPPPAATYTCSVIWFQWRWRRPGLQTAVNNGKSCFNWSSCNLISKAILLAKGDRSSSCFPNLYTSRHMSPMVFSCVEKQRES